MSTSTSIRFIPRAVDDQEGCLVVVTCSSRHLDLDATEAVETRQHGTPTLINLTRTYRSDLPSRSLPRSHREQQTEANRSTAAAGDHTRGSSDHTGGEITLYVLGARRSGPERRPSARSSAIALSEVSSGAVYFHPCSTPISNGYSASPPHSAVNVRATARS
jgi:hypothetical protein